MKAYNFDFIGKYAMSGDKFQMDEYINYDLYPYRQLISEPSSYWESVLLFPFMQYNTYRSFINIQKYPETKRFKTYTPQEDVILVNYQFLPLEIAVVNKFRPTTMLDVVSTLGGLINAIMVGMAILFYPYLYSSFKRNLVTKIHSKERKKKATLSQIKVQLDHRMSYIGLYGLYDKVGEIERR